MKFPHPPRAQLGTGALVIAALAIGQVINSGFGESSDRNARPFDRPTEVGSRVQMRGGTVTVTSVDGAKSITRSADGVVVSPGVLLVVSFDFTARKKPSTISYAELRLNDGGVTTINPSGNRNNVRCPSGPVGILVHCNVVIEAPAAKLVGAELALAPSSVDNRYDDNAIVDLKLTKKLVERFAAVKGPIEVPDVGPEGMP